MYTIRLEIPDELAEKLTPYHDQLPELLELGLQERQERERQQQQHLLQVLAASGRVEMPKPHTGKKRYVRHTPVPITGKPVSEVLMKQRGPL